ncbi:hypothetical protein ASPZODRAFT_152236 [Penicilliopsis zonata CBS 506.65]|uniref:MYND-type domain-containing protein n=1 Tax=Penicilliopsis zonata CBS 506.65 TaxID=1073090 RepID=A0A1L9SG29_9EURO|nr:hypothetical protein ASPZODRAFT_152236 [Penicilliopsis zonata CBS 506.65]OJJ45984.1 hypothetical protein ASPZODRAFT_152236 [Penicilliopsis zonata CBS 506.65]
MNSSLKEWDKPRFDAYAKLLRLKNDGQVEEASDFTEIADLPDEDSADSVHANTLSSFDEEKLKRAFLDRLSELVANEKGGHHVSSCLLIEWPDRAEVLVARNKRFRDSDPVAQLLESIALSLRNIAERNSQDSIAVDVAHNLWISLIESYRPRITAYVVEARQAFKQTVLHAHAETDSGLVSRLEDFKALINDVPRVSTQNGLEEAVQNAHEICHIYKGEEFERVTGNASHARSSRNTLGFLGRLETGFKTLIRVTGQLRRLFSSLGLSLDDQTVDSIFGNGKRKKEQWTKHRLMQRFDKLKSPVSQVHAEVQLVLAASRHDSPGASIFRYLGCSKRSCFLCSRFVRRYGQFTTRGCHSKVYDLWTLPDPIPRLFKGEVWRLVQILQEVETDMKNAIHGRKTGKRIAPVKESTLGGSSLATITQPQLDNPFTQSLVSQEKDVEQRMECFVCDQKTTRHCAHCNRDWFCSQSCQDQMSLNHLTKCSARPITTADILYADVIADEIPKDGQTREDFGFAQSHLLGLYGGLLLYVDRSDISPVTLHRWQQEGLLASRIIEIFHTIPEGSRGAYFPWFLQNQHLLDTSTSARQTRHDQNSNPILRALNAARSYLEPEDRDKDPSKLEPKEKRYSFIFYALALDGSHPNPQWPELDLWYDFGLVVCADEHHESSLGGLYARLVGGNKFLTDYDASLGVTSSSNVSSSPTCSFGEFWRAWRDGKIAQLFDKYGLGDELNLSFRLFMSFPVQNHRQRPSVWRLMHFLALEENTILTRLPQIEIAIREYGFTPQLDARTRMDLRQFYRRLLTVGNPFELHRAKAWGELLQYAEDLCGDINNRVGLVLLSIDREFITN